MARTTARQAEWHRGVEKTLRDAGLIELADERAALAASYEKRLGTTHCRECGRTLVDPVSRDLGIGPECRSTRRGRRRF